MYLCVPARTLHVKPVYIGSFTRWGTEVFPILFGDITLQTHAVQRPLIPVIHTHRDVLSHQMVSIRFQSARKKPTLPSSHSLHNSCEEGLGVEEAC